MTKRIRLALMAVVFLGFSSLAAADDELETVEKKIIAAWQKHKSMTADAKLVGRMNMGGAAAVVQGQGTYEVVKKGEATLLRMECTNQTVTTIGDQQHAIEQQIIMINDGKYIYSLIDAMGQKVAVKAKVDPQRSIEPKALFDALHKDFELKLLPEETIDGKKVYVIEGTLREKGALPVSKMLCCFRHDGVLVKQITHGVDGQPMQTTTFRNIRLDVELDPQRFVFRPPEGVQVMDMTAQQP